MDLGWSDSTLWVAIGLLGNAAFFSRFMVQWIASERAKDSVIPLAFWHLSIVGTLLLLAYAFHRRDPIFVLAYLPNAVVYVRNLMLIRKRKQGMIDPEPEIDSKADSQAMRARS